MTPNKPAVTADEYTYFVREFKSGKPSVDYAVRNIVVGDGEETRLWEDPHLAVEDDLPEQVRSVFTLLAGTGQHVTRDEWNTNQTMIVGLLLPYISNRRLFFKDAGVWSELMMAASDDMSYTDWLEASGFGDAAGNDVDNPQDAIPEDGGKNGPRTLEQRREQHRVQRRLVEQLMAQYREQAEKKSDTGG